MSHALDAERARRATLLPPGAACEACGEDDPLMLDGDAALVLCADDAAFDQSRDSSERHHLAGHRWNIVLDLTPNWHRVVTALQRVRNGTQDGDVSEIFFGLGDINYLIGDFFKRREQKRGKQRGR